MRSPGPSGPVHASHDELLVARLAGDDDLDPRERAAASALVATCADCARLASDIDAISRAVAAEPVPTRRRDFRLSPEQARELRGSRLTRLIRRFTPPADGRALGPLATGALSIGLVLVFVGSVVPRPSAVGTVAPAAQREAEPALAPAPSAAAQKVAEPPATEPDQRDTLGGAESMALEMTVQSEVAASPATGGLTEPSADMAAPEAASRSVERATVGSSPVPAAAPLVDAQGNEPEDGLAAEDTSARDISAQDASAKGIGADETATSEAGSRLRTDEGAVDEEASVAMDDAVVDTASASAGLELGTVLMAAGVVLVAVGIVLVLVLLFRRRASAHP